MRKILNYIGGNIIYKIYYSKYKKYIPKYILEQYEFRIQYMDKECYNTGKCKGCGCKTTALQMIYDSCKKYCYPTLLSAYKWNKFKKGNYRVYIDIEPTIYIVFELKHSYSKKNKVDNVLSITKYHNGTVVYSKDKMIHERD